MRNYYIVPHTSPPPIFLTHTKYCQENEICDFKEIKANKKDIEDNKNLVYRKKYMKIVPI